MDLIRRAQQQLAEAAVELRLDEADGPVEDTDLDIDEVRARVQALEQRVEAIESRARR